MKIYLAGMYASNRATRDTQSPDLLVTKDFPYPHYLESYHYVGKQKYVDNIRDEGIQVFLDSGAYSAFTQGVEIDIPAYAEYIRENADIIEQASNLDVIGAGNEQGSWDNQKKLEALGAKVLPCHHARDADYWLQKYLDEGYEHFCLGGMVPENTPFLMDWLDRIWDEYLTNSDGTPRVKIHGFGLTTLVLMFRYPWYSVDSTSWIMTSRFGGIYMDIPQPDGTIRDYKISFSDKSPTLKKDNSWHYGTMKPEEQAKIRDRLEELEAARPRLPGDLEERLEDATGYKQGYYPEALSKGYGWRDYANIAYFERAMDRRVHHFKREQKGLFG